jgi:putative tryptophan/tyrosine transport system substrate-binding protein
VRAQQAMPLVGYLHSASPEAYASMISAFHDGLKETGYVQGRNVAIEFRWAEGHVERLPALADDLVRRRISVLATGGGASPALAAKQVAAAIPTPIPATLGTSTVFKIPDRNGLPHDVSDRISNDW